ncbi:MAG TPA: SBBP repeat-containing protein, partial [Pyrinomonadaceae bacterium]|nr:SBBP repeat-containing protein [Pyrinomonadaceae bacterium]
RREVKGAYAVNGNEVRFKLEPFDSSKPLVIDPVLSYSTLLGSGGGDIASGIAVDSQGSAYVTGTTDSSNFPTTSGAFKSTSPRGVFVTKLDPTGSSLVYSTYLSGENGSSNGFGIAVDSAGNAHVTGATTGSDFPIVNGLKTTSNFFKTTDAAANWNNQNAGLVGDPRAIAVAPNAPNTIYAATGDGIYRSTDGGAVWAKTPSTGLSSFFSTTALAVDPTNSSVVYMGVFSSLFKTTDGGNNWSIVNPTPLNFSGVTSIVFDPATPSTLYVGGGNGVFKSTDSGSAWIPQNNFGIPGVPNIRALAIDPTAPLTIYAGSTNNGLFKSTNGGGIWTPMNSGMGGNSPTNVTAVVIDPANTATIYTGHGFQGGINKSTNGAASWTPLTSGVPQGGVNAMAATASAVYAAFSGAGVIKTTNGGTTWTDANVGLWSSFVNAIVVHPGNPSVVYAGTSTVFSTDAFVTKLNSSGSGLLFSTLLGGSRDEIGNGIAVDGTGNIYIAGQTSSLNFPVANAIQSAPVANDNCGNAFVTKLNPAVPSYAFSTYLGGSACEVAQSVATDVSDNVYVTGWTTSTDFPTANAFQPAMAGQFNSDAFVTKLTTDGALTYSTYLGGSNGSETGFGIAADSSGNAYITGITGSSNFPTMNPIQGTLGGFSSDAFVTKLNSQGSALVYSTFLGGSGFESGRGIAVDSANNAYVTGFSDSVEFPLVAGALRTKSPMYKSSDGAANWSNDNYGFTGASTAFGGSSITALVIHSTQPSTLYAGTGAGVFKSTNGGRTWTAVNNGLDNRNVVALVIDPLTPSTLYAATAGFVIGNTGVYKSTDGGSNWNRRSNGITSPDLISLVIDPVTPNTLYAGFSVGGPGSHLYKTTDGADNWNVVGVAPPHVPTLAIDPLNHSTLYAADLVSSGGVYKSSDGGTIWQPRGLTGSSARSVSVSPFTPGLVYAGTEQGLFRSTDGGDNWSLIPSISGKVIFDPVSSSTAYLLSTSFFPNPSFFSQPQGLFKSTDNGQTWIAMNKGLNTPLATALVIDPLNPSTLYLSSTPSGGSDAFVTKFNAAGSAFVYSTFIGGPINAGDFSNINAQAFGIALDGAGNAYVTGMTASPVFPVTPNSYQPFIRGSNDAFISKLGSSYIISGHVLNSGASPLSGVEVVLNDGGSLTSVLTE